MAGSIGGLLFVTVFNMIWLCNAIFGSGYTSAFWLVMGVLELVLVPFLLPFSFLLTGVWWLTVRTTI